MHNLEHKFLSILFLMLTCSCANIKAPIGGPEDVKAPTVKKMMPLNNSINFKEKTITLTFDENVDASKVKETIIISPLIEGNYTVQNRKKNVVLNFDTPFKENTTYTINFGESIKDVTKGNFTKNLILAFSTGSFIDSFSIQGNVYNFISEQPVKDVNVQLYNDADTNTIKNSKPLYFTKSNASGNFILNNIKEGTYTIYALVDQNRNFLYDNEKESIAYQKNIKINSALKNTKLGLTTSDTKPPEIISNKQQYEYYILYINEGLENYSIHYKNETILSSITEDKKSIHVFNTFTSKDSIPLTYILTDSSGNIKKDSIKIKFEEFKEKNKKNTFNISVKPKTLELTPNETIQLNVNKPISKVNNSLIKIKKDKQVIDSTVLNLKPDSTAFVLTLTTLSNFKDTLVFDFQKGALISLSGDSSEPFKASFKHKIEEKYGTLGGTVSCKELNYLVQLIDNKDIIIYSKENLTKFFYTYLEPGNYKLKVIFDLNKNGRWDPLDVKNNIPAEPIHYYKEKINLRANWELLDIKFDVK